MYRKRLLTGIACLLLCFVIASGGLTFAKGTDGFELSVAEAGERIEVAVIASEASNLYAYDIILKFDPLRLTYEETKISLSGFTVKPQLSRGEIRLAHTSVGAVEGLSGKVELAQVGFKRIRGGEAKLTLSSAKLVNDKLAMQEMKPDVNVTVQSGTAQKLPSDVAGHWSEAAVREAVELGFVTGFEDGTFRPDSPVTRLEATVLLAKAMLLQGGGDQASSFTDAGAIPAWAKPYVEAAVRSKWINGYGDGSFRGGQPIARQEFAAIAARSTGASSAGGHDAVLSGFADRHLLAPWATGPTAFVVERGIMQGQSGGLLNPQAATTRAEAVTMILRLLHADDGTWQRIDRARMKR